MIIHRKQRKIISDADLVAMRAARADGESFRSIAKRFGRSVGTVARKIAARSVKTATELPGPRQPRKSIANSPLASSVRLPHVTAEPFTSEWYLQCDRAFRAAMQREFPELTQTRRFHATPRTGTAKGQR